MRRSSCVLCVALLLLAGCGKPAPLIDQHWTLDQQGQRMLVTSVRQATDDRSSILLSLQQVIVGQDDDGILVRSSDQTAVERRYANESELRSEQKAKAKALAEVWEQQQQ